MEEEIVTDITITRDACHNFRGACLLLQEKEGFFGLS